MKAAKAKIDIDGIGMRLEAIRAMTGLEKKPFAHAIGIDPSTYSKLTTNGPITPKSLHPEAALQISNLWGVTLDYIYKGSLAGLPQDLSLRLTNHLTSGTR